MTLLKSLSAPLLLTALAVSALAQSGGRPDESDTASPALAPAVAPGHNARYVATYMRSATVPNFRNSTVVSVTNNSPVTCSVSADWFAGFSSSIACTTTMTLSPGFTGELCSRNIPSVACNATCSPELTNTEGRVRIASTADANGECSNIAVESRVIYTTGTTSDTGIAAVSQSKVVRVGQGNSGN